MTKTLNPLDPHAGGRVLQTGPALGEATGVLILLHGRGASARDILSLGEALTADLPTELTCLAPEAAGSVWYPESFLAPRGSNEPDLSSALGVVGTLVGSALVAGVPSERILLAGFSQGACLVSEFTAGHPARYGGVLAFTGGLVGPLGSTFHPTGDLQGTPVLLASGDPDPHVPWSRVEETGAALEGMGAAVTLRRYPGRVHTVSAQEVILGRELLGKALTG